MNKDVDAPLRSLNEADEINGDGPAEASLTDLIDGLERASFRRALEARDAHLSGVVSTAEDRPTEPGISLTREHGNPPAA